MARNMYKMLTHKSLKAKKSLCVDEGKARLCLWEQESVHPGQLGSIDRKEKMRIGLASERHREVFLFF